MVQSFEVLENAQTVVFQSLTLKLVAAVRDQLERAGLPGLQLPIFLRLGLYKSRSRIRGPRKKIDLEIASQSAFAMTFASNKEKHEHTND